MFSERVDTEAGSWTLSPASLPVSAGVVGTSLVLWASSWSKLSPPLVRLLTNMVFYELYTLWLIYPGFSVDNIIP